MSEELKVALEILLTDLLTASDEAIATAYGLGKGMAAAKSGHAVGAHPLDADIILNNRAFNAGKMEAMLKQLDAEILSINPAAYPSVAAYMEEIESIFNKYEGRSHVYTYFNEQPFYDGFLQGSKEIKDDLGRDYGVRGKDIGFTWKTAGDRKVCPICQALNGQWFPLVGTDIAWSAHGGCRCPEFFEYDVNPEAKEAS